MQDKQRGLIFDIQRFSLHDGPGIRTTVFMKGCPLRCKWCHNPESLKPYPEIAFAFPYKCIPECRRCLEICPAHALEKVEEGKNGSRIRINRSLCDRSIDRNYMKCTEVCYPGALRRIGKFVTVKELLEEIERDRVFYERSNGGVTLSGGEPLMQPVFVYNFLKECREKGIYAALDTSGYGEWESIKKILPYVSLVLYDLKHMDPLKHLEYTGTSNELILKNAERVAGKADMIVRVPVIPGYNDSRENMEETAKFITTVGSIEEVHLLSYHGFAEPKYKMLDMEYELEGTRPPSERHMQMLKSTIERYGLEVIIRS